MWFEDNSYLKDSAFTAVKRDVKFQTSYVRGVSFVNGRYTKGVPFLQKEVHRGVRSWTSGWSLPYETLLSTYSPWLEGLDLGVEPPVLNLVEASYQYYVLFS